MALEVFDFPYHLYETENPESGVRGQFGGSYIFTTPPSDPDQRKFTLYFTTMKYFTDSDGSINTLLSEKINMGRLTAFYHRHKMYKSFQYQHPVHGLLEVKFNKPLVEPKGIPNGNGTVESFSIELIEIP